MRKMTFLFAAALIAVAPACGSRTGEAQAEQRAAEDGRLVAPGKGAGHGWVMRQPGRLGSDAPATRGCLGR